MDRGDRWKIYVGAILVGVAKALFGGDWLDDFVPTLALLVVGGLLVALLVASKLGARDAFRPTLVAPLAVAAYVLLVIGNCAFDRGAEESHLVQVTAIDKLGGWRKNSVVAVTSSWRGRAKERIEVSRYQRVAPGQMLHLRVKPGAFGFPWLSSVSFD